MGDKNAMKQNLISDVCNTSPPTEVLSTLETDEKFDKNKIKIDVNNTGLCGKSKFHRAYCNHCQYILVPALLKKKSNFFSNENPNIVSLINTWDDLGLSPTQLDLIGCIFPKLENVRAAPNGRRLLERPSEHVNTTHPYTDRDFLDGKCSFSKNKKATTSADLEEVVPVKRIVATGSKQSASSSFNQLTLVSKYAKKMKYVDIASHYEQKLSVTGQCKDADDAFGKGFCISMVHTGVNKNLSNTATALLLKG